MWVPICWRRGIGIGAATAATHRVLQILHCQLPRSPRKITGKSGKTTQAGGGDQILKNGGKKGSAYESQLLGFVCLLCDQNLFKKTWFPTTAQVQNPFDEKNTEEEGCCSPPAHKLQGERHIVYSLSTNFDLQTPVTKVYLSRYQFIHRLGFYRPLYNNNLVSD